MNLQVASWADLGFYFRCVAASVAVNAKRFTTFVNKLKENLSFVKNISERLEHAIRRSGKSKGALASHIGVPQSSVSRWLAGSEPRSDRLAEIAKFLTVDVKWLMTGDEPEIAESEGKVKESGVGDAENIAERMERMEREMAKLLADYPSARKILHKAWLDSAETRGREFFQSAEHLAKWSVKAAEGIADEGMAEELRHTSWEVARNAQYVRDWLMTLISMAREDAVPVIPPPGP